MIRNNKNFKKNANYRLKISARASFLGLLSNLFLAFIKLMIYLFTHSMSILSEAINNITDCASSIISIVGIKFAQKPKDEVHPYGHGRIEYLITLVVSGMVLVVGLSFAYTSFFKIIHPVSINYPLYTQILLAISIIVKIWQQHFYLRESKKISSTTLKAQAEDARSDVLISLVVLLGVIVEKYFAYKVDGFVGFAVAIFIVFNAIRLIFETISILIGRGLNEELKREIVSKVSAYEGISNVHSIIVTDFGPENVIVIIDVEIAYNLNLEEVHNIIDKVEREVSELLGIRLIIHTDPHGSSSEMIENIRKRLNLIIRENLNLYSAYDIVRDGDHIHVDLTYNAREIKDDMAKGELKETVIEELKEYFPDYKFVIRLNAVF